MRRILAEWVDHYNQRRLHARLGPGIPDSADDHVSAGDRDTEDAHTGDDFPIKNVLRYTNASRSRNQPPSDPGLPVFLYIEVDFFEDDRQIDCFGRSCDDVLGVLPLMFTNRWLPEHPGSNQLSYGMRSDSGRARIDLTIDVWNPNADQDAPIGR